MKREIIEAILLAILNKTGHKWKTVTGLCLGGCALLLMGAEVGWDALPAAADPWVEWTWALSQTLAVAGIAHKKLNDSVLS